MRFKPYEEEIEELTGMALNTDRFNSRGPNGNRENYSRGKSVKLQ
jgi:hypothetical protein